MSRPPQQQHLNGHNTHHAHQPHATHHNHGHVHSHHNNNNHLIAPRPANTIFNNPASGSSTGTAPSGVQGTSWHSSNTHPSASNNHTPHRSSASATSTSIHAPASSSSALPSAASRVEDVKPVVSPNAAAEKRRLSEGVKVDNGDAPPKKKRSKKSSGRACVYCRRSHMVCEGGRPCERCIKREIPHLCRDPTSPVPQRQSTEARSVSPSSALPDLSPASIAPPSGLTLGSSSSSSTAQLPPTLYSDPNFAPSWPLLTDPNTAAGPTFVDGTVSNAGQNGTFTTDGNDEDLGALSKFLLEIGVPFLPTAGNGSWLDIISSFGKKDGSGGSLPNLGASMPGTEQMTGLGMEGIPPPPTMPSSVPMVKQLSQSGVDVKGKGKEPAPGAPVVATKSRLEQYLLAAADQPSGPRAARLAQVIKAKYDAGLLKPYDYVKGYERMNKWMESGRAAPKADSIAGSAPNSPAKRSDRKGKGTSATPVPTYGSSISPESRRRILAALNGFRPKFRKIAQTLTDVDLVFIEEAMERWMLEYDRAFASIHTPSCIWRRTGEIQKANQEFANLTGVPASMFRNGQLCIYELMDEDSAVRFWEGYAKVGLDAGQRALYMSCTLKIPQSLTRRRTSPTSNTPSLPPPNPGLRPPMPPDLTLPSAAIAMTHVDSASDSERGWGMPEQYQEIRCCFSVTIRRDAWGVPVAVMGQFIPVQAAKR